nr:hypothetical protein [Peribacillus glennii]
MSANTGSKEALSWPVIIAKAASRHTSEKAIGKSIVRLAQRKRNEKRKTIEIANTE